MMPSSQPDNQRPAFRLALHLEWRLTLFTLLLLVTMVSLGFWQLDRAEEKRTLAAEFEQSRLSPALPLAELSESGEPLAYRKATVSGEFIPGKLILIDNRIWQGKFGYEVVQPFQVEGMSQAVLVNRGWTQGDPSRQSLPVVAEPSGKLTLSGHIYVPPGKAYVLGEQMILEWPAILQALDMGLIADALDREVYLYSLRLDAMQAEALQVDWQIVNVSPEKHTAYAVQWFAMATVLVLIFMWYSSNLQELLRRSTSTGERD